MELTPILLENVKELNEKLNKQQNQINNLIELIKNK